MCSVQADLSGLRGLLVRTMGTSGYYWTLEFDIGIRFGGTELEAFIEWKEGVPTFHHEYIYCTLMILPHRKKHVPATLPSFQWASNKLFRNGAHEHCVMLPV